MTIHFIPNDPAALGLVPMRKIAPRPNRPASKAGFFFSGAKPEGEHAPGTPEFLFWQCREAALTAIEAWEEVNGPFASWQDDQKIGLLPDAGDDLNAFYDRLSLSFFHHTAGGKTYFSGASTDVVAHEAGHGFLDAIRPDFWDSTLFEVNAFHEAFGDCIAILTALTDKETRTAVLPKLAQKNSVEATAEELSEGIGVAIDPNHNAAAPRRARNSFKWSPPSSLPANGGPGELIAEIHSFGQLFSGCFYDLIVNIFEGMSGAASADKLLKAAHTAGTLLAKSAAQAPQKVLYFREVGRTMMLVDQQDHNGDHQNHIRNAFLGHDIALGSSIMMAPETTLAGDAPDPAAKSLTGRLKKSLLDRLGGSPTGRMILSAVDIAGERVAQAVHERVVALDGLHKRLKDVVALAPETVLLGDAHGRAAVLGALPNAGNTINEVETFVRSLLEHDRILFETPKKAKSLVGGVSTAAAVLPAGVTHTIREIRGQKTLTRLRFACAPCPASLTAAQTAGAPACVCRRHLPRRRG